MRKYSFYVLICLMLFSCVGTDELEIDKPEVSLDPMVEITPSTQAVLINESISFTATYTNTKGEETSVPFTWSSSDPSIAGVDTEGVVTGLDIGSTVVTAAYGDVVSNQATLNVVGNQSDLATIIITGSQSMMYLGTSTSLTAESFDLLGNEISGLTYAWISVDESLATIDSEGMITASSSNTGQASFYVTTQGKKSNVYTIDVLDPNEVLIRQGVFGGYGGYSVSGDVSLVQQPGGDLVIKFADNFMSAQGPLLAIYLSNSNTEIISKGIEIQELSQFSGAFDVNVTAVYPNVMITDYEYVIIHCKPFNVRFGGAQLGGVE